MNAVVADAPDLRALLDIENDDLAVRTVCRIFHLQLYVLKELRVPKRLEIPAKRLFVVGITFAAEDARFQGVCADSAVTEEFDALDDGLRLGVCRLLGGLLGSWRLGCCDGYGFEGI